jgi:copper(I)-binding protein
MPLAPLRLRTLSFTATLLLPLAGAALVSLSGIAAAAPARPVVAGPRAQHDAEDLLIEQAWIRWLPANLPAGGYLTVANHGDQPVVLVGASSPDYATIGLHRSVITDGVDNMQPVKQITVAPHSTLNFGATGYHLMLMMPVRPVAPGDRVPITLQFADGRRQVVDFEVRKPDATAPATPAAPAPSMRGMPGMKNMPGMHGAPAR